MSDPGMLAGGERLLTRAGRGWHVFSVALMIGLLCGMIAGWMGWQEATHGWMPWQKNVPMAVFKRFVIKAPWGGFSLRPEPLLPPRYRANVTRDPYKLDAWLWKKWTRAGYKPAIVKVGWWAGGGFAGGFILFLIISIRMAKTADQHRRGAQLVSHSQIAREVAKMRGRPTFQIAGVPMPFESEHQHLMLLGTTGAGKSQGIESLLEQARKQGDRVLIYDPGASFLSRFHRPEDHILNPFDQRSEAWDVLSEISTPMDGDAIAHSAIQASAGEVGSNQYFYDGARAIMAESLKAIRGGQVHEPFLQLMNQPGEYLHQILRNSPASIFTDPKAKGTGGGGIRSTLQTRLAGWQYLQADGSFSVRNWVKNEDAGWLFLTSRDSEHVSLEPLISLWTDIAARQILSREPRSGKRIWIVVDELASLQKLPSLLRLLSMGRKYRAVVLLATQSPAQLESIYKREGMRAILGTVGTRLIYRLEEVEDAENASRAFGEHELIRENASENASKMMKGHSYSEQVTKERIILPSQIQALPDLEGYLKLAGGLPATQIKTKYVDRKQIAEHIVRREIGFGPSPSSGGLKLGDADA